MRFKVKAEKVYYKGSLYNRGDIVSIDNKDKMKINTQVFEEIKEAEDKKESL